MSAATDVGEDEDLIVNLSEQDKPETDDEGGDNLTAKPPPVPGPGTSVPTVTPQVGLQDLERQIETERAERMRAQEEARQLQTERDQALQAAQEAENRGGVNYEAWVQGQIDSMAAEMENMSAQAAALMEDGDFKGASEVNKRIGRVGGQLAIAEREKLALQQQREQRGKQPRQQPKQQRQQEQIPTDPLERAIRGRTEPTKAFLRKHPDLVRGDGTLKMTAVNAHEQALDAGFRVDTDDYFKHIEGIIGPGRTAAAEPTNGHQPRVVPGYSAPVARGAAPGGDNLSPGTFRMTPKMRRLAEEQGVTPKEWATNYIRLVKEGRMTPIRGASHGPHPFTSA